MNFKNLGSIVLVLSIAFACKQKTSNTQEVDKEEQVQNESNSPQRQAQESQQTPPNPNQFQPATEAVAEVSDEELEQFVSASAQIQVISRKAQEKMITAVENGGFEVERFNVLLQEQQNPTDQIEVTKDEMQKFEMASQELEKIQANAQEQMQVKIIEEGLTENRYQEINMALQSNPDLQNKIKSIQEQTNMNN